MKQVNIEGKWCDVPNKAKYVAQDKDGQWYWYVTEPPLKGVIWGVPEIDYGPVVQEPEDWTQELYELED